MIATSISSGFGNQMFQYAAGYAAARRIGTTLRLDTSHYKNNTFRSYQLDRLSVSARPIAGPRKLFFELRRRPFASVPPARLAKRLAGVKAMRLLSEPADFAFCPDVLTAGDDVLMTGYWQNEVYFADAAEDLRREFRFNNPPNAYNAGVIADMARQTSVCVHVRRGDYLKPGEVLSPCSLAYYHAALKQMRDDVPGAKYFIFSDDPDWAKANLSVPSGTVFVTGNQGINDTDDMRLMTHCDHFVIANSSFSWWGAWLSASPGKRVIAPRPWFNKPLANENTIVPDRWLRLDA